MVYNARYAEKSPMNTLTEISVIPDRYHGTYSGGRFTAWQGSPDNIPAAVTADDTTCRLFWEHIRAEPVLIGIGETPEEATHDLESKLKRGFPRPHQYLADWFP